MKHNRLYATIPSLTPLVSTSDIRSTQLRIRSLAERSPYRRPKGHRDRVPSQFPSGLLSPDPRDSQMDRPGLHPLELRAASRPKNSLPPVSRLSRRYVPLLPPTPTNCASRRDERTTQRRPSQFSSRHLSSSRCSRRRWIILDYANAAIRQQQPLRHADQLRSTPIHIHGCLNA